MKKFILTLSLALSALLPAWAGKVVTDSLRSEVLNATVKYNVYLPDGFDEGGERYPVIYLLHGLSDDYRAWQKKGWMKAVADELMASGECVPAVIIMPNAGGADTHHVQNGYFNVENWPYEDFFFTELMPKLELKYHCARDKGHRAVMGLSMGGGGSVVYCQRHPELFSSCFAMSAWLDNKDDMVRPDLERTDKLRIVCQSVIDHSALDFLDEADDETVRKLKTIKWFADCGDDDRLLPLTLDFYKKMRQKGIPCELRVRNGIHNWEYWHYCLRTALPFASRNFGK